MYWNQTKKCSKMWLIDQLYIKLGCTVWRMSFKEIWKLRRLIYWKVKFKCCIQKRKESATFTKHNINFQKSIEIKQKMFQNVARPTEGVAEARGQGRRTPTQILVEEKAPPGSGGTPQYYLPTQIFRPCWTVYKNGPYSLEPFRPLCNIRRACTSVLSRTRDVRQAVRMKNHLSY